MPDANRILTPKQVAAIVKKIEKHKTAIGKHRDALRDLISDVEDVCDCADVAVNDLNCAVDSLSQYV